MQAAWSRRVNAGAIAFATGPKALPFSTSKIHLRIFKCSIAITLRFDTSISMFYNNFIVWMEM